MIPRTKDVVDFSPESIPHLQEALNKIHRVALNTTGDTMAGALKLDGNVGFYGKTPIAQPATIADPAGGATVDAEARTAINTLIDRLQALGLIA